MGNCTGYCTGCKDDGQRYDNNQIRSSYKEKDNLLNEDFGGERPTGVQVPN